MVAIHHTRTEREALKWLGLTVLAVLLAILMVTATGGATENATAGGTAATTGENGPRITGLAAARVVPFDRQAMPPTPFGTATSGEDLCLRIWRILEAQQAGQVEEAIAGWRAVQLPWETAVWRQVALGQAYLSSGELDAAAATLQGAADREPDNPVVHYFIGLLQLVRSDKARDWYDAAGPMRLAGYSPLQVSPNSKSMYRMVARQELQRALETASLVWLDQPLVPTYWPTKMALEPTVRDLLLAVGADRFEARAHHVLSYLELERDNLSKAEDHMDQAYEGGMVIVYGYEDLARKYEQRGDFFDAARAYAKSMKQSGEITQPTLKVLDSLRRGILNSW